MAGVEATGRVGRMTPAAARVLAVASQLFYAEGIRAVGVDAIAAEAGVTKKTLYDRFGSKATLVVVYLQRRDERWRQRVRQAAEGVAEDDARQRLLAVVDALVGWMREESLRGCAFLNAHAELPDPAHPARQIIIDQKRWLQELFSELAAQAGVNDPVGLGDKLVVLHEGGLVVNAIPVTLSTDGPEVFRRLATELVDSELDASPTR